MQSRFDFSSAKSFPKVNIFDPEVESIPVSEMIELGQRLIDPILSSNRDILCDAGISKDTVFISLINSRGGQAGYKKTTFGLGVGGTLIRDTDMLFVGEGQESCHPIRDTQAIIDIVLHQLELAKDLAVAPSRQLPVIFTPDGLVSAFVPALMAAFNGKVVLQELHPSAKSWEKVFDTKFSF
jgi:PmbA protein